MELKARPQATKDQLYKINKILQQIRKDNKDINDRKFIDGALLTLNLLIEDKHDEFFEYFDKKLKLRKNEGKYVQEP